MTIVDDVRWYHLAACLGMDTEWFFPGRSRSLDGRDAYGRAAAPALEVCAGCEVVEQCRADVKKLEGTSSLATREGVWGGTTPYDRWEAYRLPRQDGGKAWRRGQREGARP